MTTQEKCIKIIDIFNLTNKNISEIISASVKTAERKRKNIDYMVFKDEDLEKLEQYLADKKEQISNLKL